MAAFDIPRQFTVRLTSEMGPQDAFYMSRPFIERRLPAALHDHEFFEVCWIDSGSCLHFINGRADRLEAGCVLFIRPPDLHAFQNDREPPCRMVNVAFAAETARHLEQRYDDMAGRFFWSGEAMPRLERADAAGLAALRAVERSLEGGAPTLARVECALLQIMVGLFGAAREVPPEAPAWLVSACREMRSPERLRGGVRTLVGLTGRSHEHVARTFRSLFGKSPSAWINGVRMEWAARQLAETDRPILEVALDCGMEDLSHFYRVFRQVHGRSPMRYRRSMRMELVHPLPSAGR
ncbi:helix-turn-helix transcriptional regulator [Rubellimicrobium rubrum]|uniref:helix-turn-helix transcriptional regulator n=1 Tax=Rubellimicrobium rubrum TaxID=2585369 RepID=UPI00159BAE4D|nr:helix-turn-helix domain-containing protein [Rubellimicrobium rubrum]